MAETLRKSKINDDFEPKNDDAFDLDDLLHPGQAFSHPSDVVNDPDLTLNEKRAILAAWASDACAVESVPALRHPPSKQTKPVAFDDIMDALRGLDAQAMEGHRRYRHVLRQRGNSGRGSGQSGHGQPLH